MEITRKSFITNIILFFLYVVFSVITFMVTNDFLHIFMVWNLFLAAIPFAITYFIDRKYINSKVSIIIALLFWLFFFPNSIYIITDLIYIDVNTFVEGLGAYEVTTYIQSISGYVALFHIYLGSLIGLLYGFKSMSVLYYLSEKTSFYRFRNLLVIFVLFLSACGIYVGRFFRYNSWEFYKVFEIAKEFFSTFSWFSVFFILALTLLQVIIFFSFRINFVQRKSL